MSKQTGVLIKEARTAAGMTQKQLAEKVEGLSASMISKAERGEKELTPEQLKAIAEAIGVAPEALEEKIITDEELIELFKAADPETKKAAVGLLKGEKPQGGDMMSMFASMLGGAGGAGAEGAEGAEGGGNPMAGMMSMFSGMMGGAGGAGVEGAGSSEAAATEKKAAKKSTKKTEKKTTKKTKKK